MKLFTIISILVLSVNTATAQMKIPVQARAAVEFWYNEFNTNDIKLQNPTSQDIDVSILDSNTLKPVEIFILKANNEITFAVKNACLLKLYNPSDKPIELLLEFKRRDIEGEDLKTTVGKKVKLVLSNSSRKEYVLKIPSGSKPKLGPGSSTGMFFKVGDEIYFINEGKELLLLKVDESFKNGDVININKLAKARLEEMAE